MTLFYPEAVFFDLDGTLVDSAPDLTTAVNRSLADLGRPPITQDQARAWIGNGARKLVARALAGQREIDAEPPQTDAAMAAFFHHYRDCLVQASRVYDGVVEGLAQLAALECPMGVVTNKPAAFTAPLLEALGLERFFAVQVSGDTLAVKKPDPAPLLHAAATLEVTAAQSLYVGDSAADRDAARAAGMPMVRVPYGYPGDEAVFADHPAAMTLRVDALAARLAALGAMHDAV